RQVRGAERGSEGGRGGRAVEWLEDEPELVGLGGARAEEHGGVAPCEQIDLQAVGGHLDRLGVLLPEVARDDRQRRVVADRAHPAIAVAPGTLAVEVGGIGWGRWAPAASSASVAAPPGTVTRSGPVSSTWVSARSSRRMPPPGLCGGDPSCSV